MCRPGVVVLSCCLAALVTSSTAAQTARQSLADPQRALSDLRGESRSLEFARPEEALPSGGHFQGVQCRYDAARQRHLVYLSHDSSTEAYLTTVEFPAQWSGPGRVVGVLRFPSDGQSPPLRHSGGIQVCDDILAVGLEDNQAKTRSEVQFWQLTDPQKPRQLAHLTIKRSGPAKEQTAGGVALAPYGEKQFLVAVANWDSRAIDFYLSNALSLADEGCRFKLHATWQAATAERPKRPLALNAGSYQSINLVPDETGQLFLFGFDTTQAGEDVVDLFQLDLNEPPARLLKNIERRNVSLGREHHFRYAGGAWVHEGRLSLLASPRDFEANTRLLLTH